MATLPIISTVQNALFIIWRKRLLLSRALLGTSLLLIGLDTLQNHVLTNPGSWVGITLYYLAYGLIFTLFAVTCHRVILLQEGEVPNFGVWRWSWRETRFFGWTLVGGIYYILITILFAALAAVAAILGMLFANPYHETTIYKYAVLVPGSYVFARMIVLLPATAIEQRYDLKWAWKLTANNGWRLVLLVVLLPAVFSMIFDSIHLKSYWAFEIIIRVFEYVLAAIEIAVLSVSFRFLSNSVNSITQTHTLFPSPERDKQ